MKILCILNLKIKAFYTFNLPPSLQIKYELEIQQLQYLLSKT